jgi:hypothetical protein
MKKTQEKTVAKVSKKSKTATPQKIIGQKSHSEIKGENLIIQSIKIFADDTLRADSVTLSVKELKKILSSIKKSDVETFRAKFYQLCKSDKLRIDGKSQRMGLCSHARARQHCFNVIASNMGREDLVVNYGQVDAK